MYKIVFELQKITFDFNTIMNFWVDGKNSKKNLNNKYILLSLKIRICAASTEIWFSLALVCTGYNGNAEFDYHRQHIFEEFDVYIRNDVKCIFG